MTLRRPSFLSGFSRDSLLIALFAVAVVASIIGSLVVLVPMVLGAREAPPIRYGNVPFPVVNNPVRAGDVAILLVDRCNDSDGPLSYDFTRMLMNLDTGRRETLPTERTSMDAGCEEVYSRLHQLPADLTPGRYVLESTSHVPGRWRDFHNVRWRSAEIAVIATGGP